MESSSENSFTWTNTSSDSSDSPSMMPDVSLVDKSIKYEKRTKKRSKCNDCETKNVQGVKNKNQEDYESKYNVQTSMVKVEPETDRDVTKKHKKKKYSETNGDLSDLQNSASYDESYLDVRVKEELMTAPALASKIKKKNHHVNVEGNDLETKHKVEEISPNSCDMSEDIEQDTGVKTKKKKKKLKRKNQSESQEEIETSYNNDSKCRLKTKHTAPESNKCTSIAEDTLLAEHTVSSATGYDISAIQCDDHNLHTLSINFNDISQKENNKRNQTPYRSEIVHQVKSDKSDEESATDSRIPRLSDRIRFEDEDDFESEAVHNYNKNGYKSLKLKKFIQASNNMKLISQELHHNSPLTTDDEIWIVQCPRDIDIQGFLSSDFNMHGKSKIKVGGITYEATLNDSECSTTAAVLTMGQGYSGIHNLPLSGIIQLRKRIPKAHFRDDNIMINSQTNFIPLPDTKCRHPLFGANYKKAVKIPVAIAQQLNSYNEVEEVVITKERRKKKKHKTDKSILEFAETDSKPEVKEMPDFELQVTSKKKKKRKHEDDDGPAPKRSKKIKHDPESAEAWESEKAIEQNLFNF